MEDIPLTKRKGKAIYSSVYPVEHIYPWLNFRRLDDSEDEILEKKTENDVSVPNDDSAASQRGNKDEQSK